MDQRFVVVHEVGRQCLAGDSRSVYELTRDELTDVIVRKGEFSANIRRLGEYLQVADALGGGNGFSLPVEVKPHGYEVPFP